MALPPQSNQPPFLSSFLPSFLPTSVHPLVPSDSLHLCGYQQSSGSLPMIPITFLPSTHEQLQPPTTNLTFQPKIQMKPNPTNHLSPLPSSHPITHLTSPTLLLKRLTEFLYYY
ncbi:hypothetical protein L873DRAFT_523840 [Choiromyces venosus 120613-1]|uniref:Uncharacterized protein n=1 Tax=Choiromyces venosus 120613-1 TaxID=1336337 RepID=A0A3N4K4X9_9PEZI|nr:hypothetical protein L873DRAFT_523840 [Choiromyces venosus 120613-1]